MALVKEFDSQLQKAVILLGQGKVRQAKNITKKISSYGGSQYLDANLLEIIINMHTGEWGPAIVCIWNVLKTRPEYETAGFKNKFNKTYFDLAKDLETACFSVAGITSSKVNNLQPPLTFRLLISLAISYHIQKRFDEAKDLYLQCLNNRDEWHYDAGPLLNFLASLEEQVGNPGGARNWIDLDAYPLVFDPPETICGARVADFNQGLYEEVLNSPKYGYWSELQSENWYIASDLNDDKSGPFVRKLEEVFMERAERVMDQFKVASPVPDHLAFGKRPEKYRVVMFAAGQKGGGHTGPHVHSDAFMTSNYYVQVPKVQNSEDNNRGCIQYGKNMLHTAIGFDKTLRTIRPIEGMMLAWPSYISHSTIPCGTNQSRMVVGYDIVPAKS